VLDEVSAAIHGDASRRERLKSAADEGSRLDFIVSDQSLLSISF